MIIANYPGEATISHNFAFDSCAISPNGGILALGTCSLNFEIVLFNGPVGPIGPKPIGVLLGHTNKIYYLSFIDSRFLISASNDHTIKYWDTQSGETLYTWENPGDFMTLRGSQLVISPATGPISQEIRPPGLGPPIGIPHELFDPPTGVCLADNGTLVVYSESQI